MQLKKKVPARTRGRAGLAAATLSLLNLAPAAASGDAAPAWEFDSALLLYSESGGRVQAAEPVLKATRDLGDDRLLTVKLVLDALTGASPNGATPASTPQTFSGPSGGGHTYTAPANTTPLDDSFHDTRAALSADYLFPVSADGKLGLGLNFSEEFDFMSAGASARYSLDFNQSNTTLTAGLGYESDQVDPVGGAPAPLSPMAGAGGGDGGEPEDDEGGGDTLSKDVIDITLGVTQVLSPASLVQFNYSLSQSDGYQNDPYKILSVVGADGEPLRYVYEGRPDTRAKHALFARYKRFALGRDVVDASYRYLTDDWGVQSHTADVTYRWNFGEQRFVEPHLRWYTQTAADFYRAALYDGQEAVVDHATADPRLGAFDGVTVGLKYGSTFASGAQWTLRGEYYRQYGRTAGVPDAAADGLSKFDLAPDLSAVMVTVGYRFNW